MEYNGWKNYETWAVALWFDNEVHTQSMYQRWAKACWEEALSDATFTRQQNATLLLSETLKRYVEGCNPLSYRSGMYTDLLGAALSEVDYYEIAENWLEDVEK